MTKWVSGLPGLVWVWDGYAAGGTQWVTGMGRGVTWRVISFYYYYDMLPLSQDVCQAE